MMKFLYTSDIHASPEHLYSMLSVAEKEKVDCIIIGGDIVPHYLPDTRTVGVLKAQGIYLENIFIPTLRNFKKHLDASIYLDLGNDDFVANRNILKSHENNLLYLLHMRKYKLIDGVDIIGYMNVPPTPFTRKDWEKPDSAKMPFAKGNQVSLDGYSSKSGDIEKTFIDLESHDTIEKDLAQLSQIITGAFIFVSHSPPYLTDLDVLDNGLHVAASASNGLSKNGLKTISLSYPCMAISTGLRTDPALLVHI